MTDKEIGPFEAPAADSSRGCLSARCVCWGRCNANQATPVGNLWPRRSELVIEPEIGRYNIDGTTLFVQEMSE